MGFFKWKDQFSVHVQEMDHHHKKFFALLNKMYDYNKMEDGDPEFLNGLFRELSAYVLVHFQEEEKLLARAGFDGLENQKIQHQYFRDHLVKFRAQHFNGQDRIPANVLHFMRDWFLDHVLEADGQYGKYFADRPFLKMGYIP